MGISEDRQAIIDIARSHVGTPWRHQGRDWDTGVDCVGMPVLIGIERGYFSEDMRVADYPRRPNQTLISLFDFYLERVTPMDLQPADLLVFADSGTPCHCGFLFEQNGVPHIVHAHAHDRQIIEEPLSRAVQYLNKPVFRYKYKGLI